MINMIYYVSRRGIRTVMGIILLWVSIWYIFSNLLFAGVHYFIFTLITLVIAINLILDVIGTNRLTVNETQITLYRLPFFIKRIPLSMVLRLDYVEDQTVFGRNEILRVYFESNRHIDISNYSVDSSIIKMDIEEAINISKITL